jgi:hypothetical protein
VQLYYIRPRFGDFFWDAVKATKLRVMLESAIQRRFPKGLKVGAQGAPLGGGARPGPARRLLVCARVSAVCPDAALTLRMPACCRPPPPRRRRSTSRRRTSTASPT